MAQLTDDCFAFGGPMLSVADAVALIGARIAPVAETDRLPLAALSGRVLADDVRARVDVPSADNSAVDGYAVRHADLASQGESRMPVTSRVQAGMRSDALTPGTAVRIFTGAPMPAGADTVFMQEDVSETGGMVALPSGLKAGANRRFAGEDFRAGAVVAARGTRLDVRHIAALAATGVSEARVFRKVRVALFSTGDELALPGEPLAPGSAYDANRPMLAAMLAARGVEVSDLGILRDNAAATADALRRAASHHDVILTSGGVSTGEADFVKDAVEASGALTFWRLAIKPGRPVAMGTIDGAAFVGLPGNPVAAYVTFVRLAAPLIDQLAGRGARLVKGVPAIADFKARKKAGRREYVRGACRIEAGRLVVAKFPREGAALISSLIGTDGLIELDEEATEISPGDPVTFLAYGALSGD